MVTFWTAHAPLPCQRQQQCEIGGEKWHLSLKKRANSLKKRRNFRFDEKFFPAWKFKTAFDGPQWTLRSTKFNARGPGDGFYRFFLMVELNEKNTLFMRRWTLFYSILFYFLRKDYIIYFCGIPIVIPQFLL